MGDVTLTVIGCGDAMGTGGRNNTCYLIDDDFGRFTIDFGASSLVALNALSIVPDTIDAIYLTHLHGDHFGGLPSLLMMREYQSDAVLKLTIAGPPGLEKRIIGLCEAMFPGMWKQDWTFPLDIVEILPGAPVELLDRLVLTHPVTHYAGPEPSTALRIETNGTIIGYSGDTGWNDVLFDIAKGTDIFLCDCFDRHDKPFEGHLSYDALLRHAHLLETDRLVITHLGPEMCNTSEEFEIEQAHDGLVIQLTSGEGD